MQHSVGLSFVSSDELIGNVVQVIAYDLRLRADPQNIVAGAFDQRCLPARRDGAEVVTCVAGDNDRLRKSYSESYASVQMRPLVHLVLFSCVYRIQESADCAASRMISTTVCGDVSSGV
jgi:hypothetical protein